MSRLILTFVWGLIISSGLALAQPYDYVFYELGDLGYPIMEGQDINEAGTVAGFGSAYPDPELCRAFIWNNGVLTNMSQITEGVWFSAAASINARGDLAGIGFTWANGQYEAIVYTNGTAKSLPLPNGCEKNDKLCAISDNGRFACGEDDLARPLEGSVPSRFSLVDDTALALGFLPGTYDDACGDAFGVNNDGVVVGRILDGTHYRAFIWEDGEMSEIRNTLGGEYGGAVDINNSGGVVGGVDTPEGDTVFLYRDGVMTSLGLGEPSAVNERDQVAGDEFVVDSDHALLFAYGQVIDLHPYVPSSWFGSWAKGINDFGWIVVNTNHNENDDRACGLLVPIYPKGDYDGDEDVDLHDFGHFQRCFAAEPFQGPGGGLHVGCSVFDFDDDVDLDLTDYDAFQTAFTGAVTSGW